MRPTCPAAVLLVLLPFVSGCATLGFSQHSPDDLPKFIQVDEGYYRGGQPTPEGMRQLAHKGIKMIISLRQHTRSMEQERRLAESLGMRWVNIPMWYFWWPSDDQVREFLAIATDPASRPVYVHCRRGVNRAGIMTAIYRVAYQRWQPEQAYAEALRRGLAPWNIMTRWVLFHTIPRTFVATRS